MTTIVSLHHLSLAVTDLDRSVAWYREVLGFEVADEITRPTFRRARLRHARIEVTLTLTHHTEGHRGSFDERRVGLDHLAFGVATSTDVDRWGARLDELDVPHSGSKPVGPPGSGRTMITLRDPDDIQLEIIAVAPAAPN